MVHAQNETVVLAGMRQGELAASTTGWQHPVHVERSKEELLALSVHKVLQPAKLESTKVKMQAVVQHPILMHPCATAPQKAHLLLHSCRCCICCSHHCLHPFQPLQCCQQQRLQVIALSSQAAQLLCSDLLRPARKQNIAPTHHDNTEATAAFLALSSPR